MFHPTSRIDNSRLSINGELNETNEEKYFADKIISNNINKHEYIKPKILESRLKTTNFYQSEEDLNDKRTNDDNTNHKVSIPIIGTSLARKHSLFTTRNKDENFYETNVDNERNRLSNSTLSTYTNVSLK